MRAAETVRSFASRRAAVTAVLIAALAPVGLKAAMAAEVAPATQAVIDYDKAGIKLGGDVRIAYLAECTQNSYCQARLKGVKDAAAKFGFTFKLFDANFNPADQLKQTQNAVAERFDGFLMGPTASAPACSMWKQFLVPTGKPVVTVDLPMCGSVDHTPGLAGTVTMQRQGYFNDFVANAFQHCPGDCKVAAVGGFVGSDLFNLWEGAIKAGLKAYPNVKVVADQPGNFDPRMTLRVIQDAMRAHPDLTMVISPWDDMTRGAEQAITSSGKKPGTDIKIFSMGGTKDGVARVKDGTYEGTDLLLPYEEAYYGAVALVMAIAGKPVNGYIDEAMLPRVTEGPGTVFITKDNAGKFEANY